MSANQKAYIKQAIAISIVLFTIGTILLGIIGMINGDFFPRPSQNQISITKSPLRIIYKGDSNDSIIELVKEIKDIPFVDYKFNENTNISINTESKDTKSSNTNFDFSQKSVNKIDTGNTKGTQTSEIDEEIDAE